MDLDTCSDISSCLGSRYYVVDHSDMMVTGVHRLTARLRLVSLSVDRPYLLTDASAFVNFSITLYRSS